MQTLADQPLGTLRIGRRVLYFNEADSTNNIAAAHAGDPTNEGLVVLADVQTAGRGRYGRSWASPPGAGILCSVLLHPEEPWRRPAILTALAAVAVCETIFEITKLQASIKWPNDVLLKDRKVCGILVEQGKLGPSSGAGPASGATVIGIGLNVNTPAAVFAEAGLPQAGSLASITGEMLSRDHVARTLLRLLDQGYDELHRGMTGDLESRWRWHSGLLGRQVMLQDYDGWHLGRLVEMSFAGITLQYPTGDAVNFQPERVQQIRQATERQA